MQRSQITDPVDACPEQSKTLHFQAPHRFEMPSCETLKKVISCAYQASLQTDEQRPVTFRLIYGAADAFPRNQDPRGLHSFEFAHTLPFEPFELRKVSAAAAYHRSLIGIFIDRQRLSIWGAVHSGVRWLKVLQGGRADNIRSPLIVDGQYLGTGIVSIRPAIYGVAGTHAN